ncbi:MAG: hypothetical protein ACI4TG_02195 [Ruminococcus sp.]
MEVRLRADNFKSYKVYPWIGEFLHLKGSDFFLFTIIYDKSNQGKDDVVCKPKDLMAMMKCSRQTLINATNHLKSAGLIYRHEKNTDEGILHCYRINMDKIKPLEKEIKEYNEQLQKEYEALENRRK